ncbi:MAG TPA: hypothetical protein VGX22_00310, partial [Candidatus Dormibacteraeota bacterium]|nr:hypothetical protein [Candidatus Dormibacteraeota bacterium]
RAMRIRPITTTTSPFTLVCGAAGVVGTMAGAVGTMAAGITAALATASRMAGSDMVVALVTAAAATAVAVMGAEISLPKASFVMVTLALLGFAAGCDGAREVDYRPSRGISADIDATHETGATSLRRGMTTEGEPYGAMPWKLGQRHQE